jgi:hypothetical protein
MTRPPAGLVALSLFFTFGAIMAATTCLALLFPVPAWAVMWRVNPESHAAFQAMGSWAPVLMLCVATACALAAIGLWNRTQWGHRLAIAVLLVNMVGDLGNAIVRGDLRTLIGIPIAAAMIAYLVILLRR